MRILLTLTLLLNLALGTGWLLSRNPERAPQPPLAPTTNANAIDVPPAETPSRAAIPPWDTLESSHPGELMARLVAAGCPRQTAHDIVVLRICRAYAGQLRELEAAAARDWDYRKHPDAAALRELNQRRRQMRDQLLVEIEELTGEPWESVRDARLGWPARINREDYLPLDTRQKLRRIEADHADALRELQGKALALGWNEKVGSQLGELEAKRTAAVAQLLSPVEHKEYLLRESRYADLVRQRLPEARNESEFRAMVQAALDVGVLDGVEINPTEARKRETELLKRLESLLGPERLAELRQEEKARQDDERRLEQQRRAEADRIKVQAAARSVGADESAAGRFFDRLQELEPQMAERFRELEQSLTGSPEDRARQMRGAVRAEMKAVAVPFLGDKADALLDRLLPPSRP